jgi:hypothetical protein
MLQRLCGRLTRTCSGGGGQGSDLSGNLGRRSSLAMDISVNASRHTSPRHNGGPHVHNGASQRPFTPRICSAPLPLPSCPSHRSQLRCRHAVEPKIAPARAALGRASCLRGEELEAPRDCGTGNPDDGCQALNTVATNCTKARCLVCFGVTVLFRSRRGHIFSPERSAIRHSRSLLPPP